MEIPVNKPVTREVVIRALTDDMIKNRQCEFVISSEEPDTFGTVFKISGWNLVRYEKNPLVLYVHKSNDPNPDLVIGTSVLRIENGLLIGLITFEPEDINPLAEKIWRKVKHGTLKMASVGALPLRGHWGDEKLGENKDLLYFDESELLEWSIVPIGSNPEAMKRSAEAMEEIRNAIPKQAEEKEEKAPEPPTIKRTVREAQLIINQNLQ